MSGEGARSGHVACVALSKDGRFLVSGGKKSEMFVWNANMGECVRPLRGHTNLVNCVAYSGNTLASGSETQQFGCGTFGPARLFGPL